MISIQDSKDSRYNFKLLYVEDNEISRISTLSVLEELFKYIVVAVDGEDGLEKFQASTFDIIITDINMPKLNGLQMAKKIRELDKYVPIILNSAHDDTDFFLEGINIGIDGYLMKPFEIDPLCSILEKINKNLNTKNEAIELRKKLERREARRIDKILNNSDKQEIRLRSLYDKIEATEKHRRESIEYAALIQSSILPDDVKFSKYFKNQFMIWHPKDIVGGDIYLFEELRDDDECLFMFIDCTGHGVPGAFVTMLVKAVEREIVSIIINDPLMDVSPAWIMGYFNKTLKKLLNQESKNSKSNAGWDGGIIYYNKKTQILKFAGAETPLFYMDTNDELHTVKGNRYSVGYKKCDPNYQYKETILEVKEGMKFYCTTDGYLDQNGGAKDFPFGKKRFGNIIKENHTKSMLVQRDIFLDEMQRYEDIMEENYDRNDDMTVIAFEIDERSKSPDTILKYDGELTQGIITHCVDTIEKKIPEIGMMGKVSTLAIELTQNMMNYSKSHHLNCTKLEPAGLIEIFQYEDGRYTVRSKSILSLQDKIKVEPKILEIQSLDSAAIRKRYRELRKSGENTHEKGGGIGFFEIAKLCDSIEYEFTSINDEKYYYEFRANVIPKKKKERE